MASNALKQLIGDANWGELDYFILDTPPGTSDIHLTLVQTLAITGAVIVSTPQQVALADARKGINMYTNDKVNVPILGLIENMSWFTPAELPENKYYLFGREGAKQLAEDMNVPLLGQIPIVQSICENGDKGTPAALDETTITGRAFLELAENVVKQTEKRNAEQAPTHIVELKSKFGLSFVILNEVKDLVTSTLCFRILHFIQNDRVNDNIIYGNAFPDSKRNILIVT